jgi:hypothetical protein
MTKSEIRRLIKESIINMINEGDFFMDDARLKELAQEKLEVAHKALNNLMMPLLVNSNRSEFAKNLFNQVKQADDAILFARKDF